MKPSPPTERFLLHHAVKSRSFRILWLLEEAQTPYAVSLHDFTKATQKDASFLALNPDGKVPVVVDRGPDGSWSAVVTESVAICAYVADALPQAALAPAVSSPQRAAYMTWLAYYGSSFEPAFADTVFPRQGDVPRSALGWSSFDLVVSRVARGVEPGPWLLGNHFSAADILYGSMLHWLQAWGKLPPNESLARYLTAIQQRDGWKRAQGKEAEMTQNASLVTS